MIKQPKRVYVLKEVLPMFNNGKTVEIRLRGPVTDRIETGDHLEFVDGTEKLVITRRVVDIRTYSSPWEVLDDFSYQEILPGLSESKSDEWICRYCRVNSIGQESDREIFLFVLAPL